MFSPAAVVLRVVEPALTGLGPSLSHGFTVDLRSLLRSIAWPFALERRRSGFSSRDLNRFSSSMDRLASLLLSYHNELVDGRQTNKEQKVLKYFLDKMFAKTLHNEGGDEVPPAWIRHDRLFSGWMQIQVSRAIAKCNDEFMYSLSKGCKQAWPSMSDDVKIDVLKGHRSLVTSDKGEVPSFLRNTIIRTAKTLFGSITSQDCLKFMPTGSSCLQASRKKGGALSLVSPPVTPLSEKKEGDPKPEPPGAALVRELGQAESVLGKSVRLGKYPRMVALSERWRRENFNRVRAKARGDLCPPSGFFPFIPRNTAVRALALAEPGKFRIVTLGDGFLYSAIQPQQGAMLSKWKRSGYSTMLDDDQTMAVRKMDALFPDLSHWCSVDYSKATDLLKRDATRAAFEGLGNLPDYDLVLHSLGPGKIEYRDGRKRDSEGKTYHINGLEPGIHVCSQLMGHPLSFSTLCAINLAVFRASLRKWVVAGYDLSPYEGARRNRIEQRFYQAGSVLVNGDDMLFKCEPSLLPIFVQTAREAGLEASPGKNFLSRTHCTINSQLFARRGGVMVRRGYLNQRLLTGVSLKSGESNSTPTQIARDINRMCELYPKVDGAIPFCFSRFTDLLGKGKRGKGTTPNWFLPVSLGGLGLDPKFSTSGRFGGGSVTLFQRRLAALFIHDPSLSLYRTLRDKSVDPQIGKFVCKLGKSLLSPRPIFGDHVAEESESLYEDDPWVARAMMLGRAQCASNPSSIDSSSFDEFKFQRSLMLKAEKKGRLQPVSAKNLPLYANIQWFCGSRPPCPPLLPLLRGGGGTYMV